MLPPHPASHKVTGYRWIVAVNLRICFWQWVSFSHLISSSIFFQEADFQSETIRFGTERMTIDSWVRKRTYDAFREFVGSGMNYHLQVCSLNVLDNGVNI